MFKPIAVLTASVVAAVAATSLADASKSATGNKPAASKAVTVVAVLGQTVKVPVGQSKVNFVMAYAFCPKGYYVTGGGGYNGAITMVVSAPMRNLRGWFIDGFNSDPLKRTFTETASAVCVKGTATVPIAAAAANPAAVRQAEADAIAAHSGR